MRIVAKLLEDFSEDWHWVDLENPQEIDHDERVFEIDSAETLCGILLSGPTRTRLHDTGAPPQPDCPSCLKIVKPLSAELIQDISEALGD